ncbi:hypothetical protein ABK040_001413 [Willaertia magna]
MNIKSPVQMKNAVVNRIDKAYNKAANMIKRIGQEISPVREAERKQKELLRTRTERNLKERNLDHPSSIPFGDEDFDPKDFAESLFIKVDFKKIESNWINGLQNEQNKSKQKLQELVSENYEKFIDASKEVSNFIENDLIELNNLILNLKNYQLQNINLKISKDILNDYKLLNNLNIIEIELLPEMEINIFKRKFNLAIEYSDKIELLLKNNLQNDNLKKEYMKRKTLFIETLKNNILRGHFKKEEIKYLNQLDCIETTIEIYLKYKTNYINNKLKYREEGDFEEYINNISIFVFNYIQSTGIEFIEYFPETFHMSFYMQWVFKTITEYLNLFKIQILSQNDIYLILKCLKIIFEKSMILEKNGMMIIN